jgi:phosphatidyl-myo-inositol dimannoside synthase
VQLTKLLLVTAELPPQPGGIGIHAHYVAKNLCEHSFKVTIVADVRSNNGEEELIFDAQQPYTVVRIKRKAPIAGTYLKRYKITKKLLESHDLLLVSGKFPIWIGGLVSLTSKKKVYAVVHGSEVATPSVTKKKFTKWCLSRFEKVIAVSTFTKSLMAGWNIKNIQVIPNGHEMEPSKVRNLNGAKLAPRLITIGNVTQRKGQHNVIRALPKLKTMYPAITYDIVGIPTEKERILQEAKSMQVEDLVVLHGKVSEIEKIRLLENASIFMMLSENTLSGSVEGFGIAILEANAKGIPTIGSKGCGVEDAISHGVSGKLVAHNDTEAICNAVQEITTFYDKYTTGAINWSEGFKWDKIILHYVQTLKK